MSVGCHTSPNSDTSAFIVCGQFVEDRIGVKMADYDKSRVITLSEKRYSIVSSAIYQGQRRNLACIVEYRGDRNWKLISLTFLS